MIKLNIGQQQNTTFLCLLLCTHRRALWWVWEFACLQSALCPCAGQPEVIWFINDHARSALLHLRTVCSNGFLQMDSSHEGLHCNAGSAEAVTLCSFTQVWYRSYAINPINRAILKIRKVGLSGEEFRCDCWYGNVHIKSIKSRAPERIILWHQICNPYTISFLRNNISAHRSI